MQIIYHFLNVSIDICMESQTFYNNVPYWFNSLLKYIYSPLWNEALNIIVIILKFQQQDINIQDTSIKYNFYYKLFI